MFRLKDFAQALKHIADIIERGIRDHPELSVGMQTEGIEVRWRPLIGQRMIMKPSDWLIAGEECGQHPDPAQDGAD